VHNCIDSSFQVEINLDVTPAAKVAGTYGDISNPKLIGSWARASKITNDGHCYAIDQYSEYPTYPLGETAL
jgi:hypothetical protein